MKQPLIGVWMDQSHTNENKEFVQNLFIHLDQSCAFYARHIAADCARLFKTALLCFAIGIQKSKHLNNSAWSKSNSIQRRCIESQRKKNAKNNNKKIVKKKSFVCFGELSQLSTINNKGQNENKDSRLFTIYS